jgi:hypothetical protein
VAPSTDDHLNDGIPNGGSVVGVVLAEFAGYKGVGAAAALARREVMGAARLMMIIAVMIDDMICHDFLIEHTLSIIASSTEYLFLMEVAIIISYNPHKTK